MKMHSSNLSGCLVRLVSPEKSQDEDALKL